MIVRVFAALLALASTPAVPQALSTRSCPKPLPVPAMIAAAVPNSTYYSDGDPPARFAHAPTGEIRLSFGKAAVEHLCGKPPCNMVFVGCTRGDQMAILDPFGPDFARVMHHELAHVNGWPATHGN